MFAYISLMLIFAICFVTSLVTCFKTHCKNTKRIDIIQYKYKESLDIIVFLMFINTKRKL